METIPHRAISVWEEHERERNLVHPGNFTKHREKKQGEAGPAHMGLVGPTWGAVYCLWRFWSPFFLPQQNPKFPGASGAAAIHYPARGFRERWSHLLLKKWFPIGLSQSVNGIYLVTLTGLGVCTWSKVVQSDCREKLSVLSWEAVHSLPPFWLLRHGRNELLDGARARCSRAGQRTHLARALSNVTELLNQPAPEPAHSHPYFLEFAPPFGFFGHSFPGPPTLW